MNALRHRNFRLLFAARTISFFGTNLVPIAVAFAVLDIARVGVGGRRRVRGADVRADLGAARGRRRRRPLPAAHRDDRLRPREPRDPARARRAARHRARDASGRSSCCRRRAARRPRSTPPPRSASCRRPCRPDALQQANGFMSIARYSAAIFGAAAGGALVATIGAGWAILLDGTTYAASALLLCRDAAARRRAHAWSRTRLLRDLARGLAGVRRAHVGLAARGLDRGVLPDQRTRRSSCSARTSRSRRWAAPARGRRC